MSERVSGNVEREIVKVDGRNRFRRQATTILLILAKDEYVIAGLKT